MDQRTQRAISFGVASDAYQRGRPDYPLDLVIGMLDGAPPGRVADVGAGTGKLTRALIEIGREVVAVDPDAAMLATLGELLPDVERRVGTAEEIPLPDRSMAALAFGQSWHWVQVERASVEAARVLQTDGVLGLIWNLRDERTDWMAELGRIVHLSDAEQMVSDGDFGPTSAFDTPEHTEFEWTRPMTRSDLFDMVRSRSYFLTADRPEQQRMIDELTELFDQLPALADGGTIDAPYISHAYKYRSAA